MNTPAKAERNDRPYLQKDKSTCRQIFTHCVQKNQDNQRSPVKIKIADNSSPGSLSVRRWHVKSQPWGNAYILQHITTGWPNVCNMFCPTILQDVGLTFKKRLTGMERQDIVDTITLVQLRRICNVHML